MRTNSSIYQLRDLQNSLKRVELVAGKAKKRNNLLKNDKIEASKTQSYR
jgi:hypothetical protein